MESSDLNDLIFWQCFRPCTLIAVPSDCNHSRDVSEFVQNRMISDIARVDDQLGTFEVSHRFRSQQPVSIRYYSNNVLRFPSDQRHTRHSPVPADLILPD